MSAEGASGNASPTTGKPATAASTRAAEPLPEPSALGQAALLGMEIDGIQRQIQHLADALKQLRRQRQRWEAGGRAEQSVVQVLVGMDDAGWHLLPDRRWPGTRRANIDVIVVGPGGVFVVDVKNWREVTIEGGRLWRGDADSEDDLQKLVDQTVAVEEVLAEAGLPPTEVVPLLVLAGRKKVWTQLDRVTVLGELDLTRDLVRRGARLAPDHVEQLLDCLERGCPPMIRATTLVPALQPVRRPVARRAGPDGPTGQDGLLSREELWQELVDSAAREPIESWMTWLHPTQARLAGRQWSGPARVRGAAGTGKTVVALHRAKYLAARGERVLFTTLVRTLGPVYRALLARMAPEHVDRIEFATVHAVATRCLREHGLADGFQQGAAEACFGRAWQQVGRSSVLPGLGLVPRYWQDEIALVIKGRGLTDFEQYAKLARVGRSTPLQASHRRAVWALYERYEQLRTERGVLDGNDALLLARDLVRGSSDIRYGAVIVDEVQDLTCVALQLLHAFVGDKPDGLLVVGDGQQSIYPGGFTLAEAGVSVVGRSTVLARNYRNREKILSYAQAVVADDSFDDLDGVRERGRREVVVDRPGGEICEVTVSSAAAQDAALCEHLMEFHDNRGVRYGDMAVLVPTNDAASRWQGTLARRGIPAVSLLAYDGASVEKVKVGTYHRAKSLDFAHVCIPDRNLFPKPQQRSESADAFRERTQLERRQLYVAITRARDSVWVGIREDASRPARHYRVTRSGGTT